jgi:hypothetical protein
MSRIQRSARNAFCIPAEKQTEEQRAVLKLLVEGCSLGKAAKAVGVERRVVDEWIKSGLLSETVTRLYMAYLWRQMTEPPPVVRYWPRRDLPVVDGRVRDGG